MTTIKLKNGSGAPTAGDLVTAEPALDLTNKRLYTEDSGGTVIEVGTNPGVDVTFADNRKAVFGAGSDLQIYHDGLNSYISDTGIGDLYIKGSTYVAIQDASGNNTFAGQAGGASYLYYAGSGKLATTATGIDVTGTVTADSAKVENSTTSAVTISESTGGGTAELRFVATESFPKTKIVTDVSAGSLSLETVGNERLNIASNGDISFYEDTGTTAKFFWDASAESLGIGTSSPIGKLDVSDGTNPISIDSSTYNEIQSYNRPLLLNRQGNNVGIGTDSPGVLLDCSGSSPTIRAVGTSASNPSLTLSSAGITAWSQTVSGSDSSLSFNKDGSERMRIDSSGNLLVGTTDASGTTGSGIKLTNPTSPADDGKLMIVGASTTIAQDGIQMYSTGASAYRFFVQYSGQINATSTSINAISDVSLKENIRDLDKGLETILALQPRRFDWKNGDGNDIMGFVAQEVETVLPELVHDYKYNDEETKLGLKMGDMIPSLVKAIQEQNEIINDLRARVAQLEGAN